MKLFDTETSAIVPSIRELSAEDIRAISAGRKTVYTMVEKTTVHGKTPATVSRTVCATK